MRGALVPERRTVCAPHLRGAVTCRGDESVQRANRRSAYRVNGVRTGDCGRNGRDRRDQVSAHLGADRRRARAVADSRAAQRKVHLRKKRDLAHRTDQFDRDCAVIYRSGEVDSEEDEIELITIDRGIRLIGEVVTPATRTVRYKKLKISVFIRCAPRPVKRPLRVVTAKAQLW